MSYAVGGGGPLARMVCNKECVSIKIILAIGFALSHEIHLIF